MAGELVPPPTPPPVEPPTQPPAEPPTPPPHPRSATPPAGHHPGPGTPGRATAPPAWLLGIGALLLYLAVAIGALGPGLFSGNDSVVGNNGDPSIFIWSLQWTPFAISHHLDPLFTTYLHYPTGANLMWSTSIVFPALVLWPVTWLAGALVSYNVLCVLGMALSGWCAYLMVGRWTQRWTSAALAGLLYEVSPYMMSQITGHPSQFVAVFPPLLVLLGDEILVRRRRPAWRWGALLGLAAACQLMTGSEMLLTSGLMAVIAALTLAAVFRGRLAERLGYAARALGVALAVFAVLAAYPVYMQFLGPQAVHGVLQGYGYTARPTSFVLPSAVQLISGPSAILDSSVYIGLPMLVLAVVVAVRLRHRAEVMVAGVILASTIVLALGGHLTIHGGPTRIPLPWDLAQKLPVLQAALPTRLMVYGYLALALLLGVFTDSVLHSPGRRRLAGLAVAVVALVPLIPRVPVSVGQYTIPAYFTDGQAAAQLDSTPGGVLITPYGSTPVIDYFPQVWQAVSGLGFRSPVGLVFTPGPTGHSWGPRMDALGTELHALGELGASPPAALSAAQRATYLSDLAADGITALVAGPSPGQGQVVRFVGELLGRPGVSTGGVVVWTGIRP